jgi:hypothetical protein
VVFNRRVLQGEVVVHILVVEGLAYLTVDVSVFAAGLVGGRNDASGPVIAENVSFHTFKALDYRIRP